MSYENALHLSISIDMDIPLCYILFLKGVEIICSTTMEGYIPIEDMILTYVDEHAVKKPNPFHDEIFMYGTMHTQF